MNFIYVIHLMCWNYLIDLITDNRNRNSKNRSNSGDGNNKGDASGANVPAPAEDVDNENPSLVALGKNGQKVVQELFWALANNDMAQKLSKSVQKAVKKGTPQNLGP